MFKFFNKAKSIFERLKTINDAALFAEVLNEFCAMLFYDELKEICTKIEKKYQQNIKPLKKLEKNASKETDDSFMEIKDFVKKYNIKDPWILSNIEEFRNSSKYKTGPTYNKFIAMNMIQIALYSNTEGKKCKYAMKTANIKPEVSNDDFYLKSEKLFPNLWKWHRKKIELELVNEILGGVAFNKLKDFFNCYNFFQFETLKPELIKKGHNIKILNCCRHSLTVGYLLGTPRSYYDTEVWASRLFDIQKFKQYVGRVLNSIENYVAFDYKQKNSNKISEFLVKYKSSTAELMINNDKPIDFKKNEDPAKFLNFINEKMNSKKNKLPLFLIRDHLFSNSDTYFFSDKKLEKEEIKKIKGVRRQIHDRVKDNGNPIMFRIIKDESMSENKIEKNHHMYLMFSSQYKLIHS